MGFVSLIFCPWPFDSADQWACGPVKCLQIICPHMVWSENDFGQFCRCVLSCKQFDGGKNDWIGYKATQSRLFQGEIGWRLQAKRPCLGGRLLGATGPRSVFLLSRIPTLGRRLLLELLKECNSGGGRSTFHLKTAEIDLISKHRFDVCLYLIVTFWMVEYLFSPSVCCWLCSLSRSVTWAASTSSCSKISLYHLLV